MEMIHATIYNWLQFRKRVTLNEVKMHLKNSYPTFYLPEDSVVSPLKDLQLKGKLNFDEPNKAIQLI